MADKVDLRFDSLDAMLDHVEAKQIPDWVARMFKAASDDYCPTKSVGEALTLARAGWQEGRAKAAPLTSALFSQVSSKIERHDPIHDIEGSQIDIAAYVDGQPECWTRLVPTIVDGTGNRILRIGYNLGASASVSSDTLIAKGATVAALVELLELAGYRVELWALKASTPERHDRGEKTPLEFRTLLKSADQDFDMARIVYALAHPSVPRILGLTLAATEDEKIARKLNFYDGGNWDFYSADSTFKQDFDLYFGRSIIWNGEEVRWKSPESAQAFIISQLKAAGVELSED